MRKSGIALLSLLFLFCFTANVFATPLPETELAAKTDALYRAEEVKEALTLREAGNLQTASKAYEELFLPTSMGIESANLNMDVIYLDSPLRESDQEMIDALVTHGYSKAAYKDMTLSEYRAIEGTWLLGKNDIANAKYLYPELAKEDLTKWTWADFNAYALKTDTGNYSKQFTAEQLATLEKRGIRIDDTFWLFKEYYTVDTILAQSDEALREVIERAYNTKEYMVTGESRQSLQATPPADLYDWTYYNYYGYDWFHIDTRTTEEYYLLRSNRTVHMSQKLYNVTNYGFYGKNMYGTYSQSQNGAHEGIDFSHPSGAATPTIYAIFRGYPIAGAQYHQIAVAHNAAPGGMTTFNYLHMSSKTVTVNSYLEVGASVGKQGNEGNATGYHVHFEVQPGKTASLSVERNNHSLDSLSPYQMQYYIGGP